MRAQGGEEIERWEDTGGRGLGSGAAVFAGLGNHLDDKIDPFGGNQSLMRAAVSRLSSGFAPRFFPLWMHAFAHSWSVGGWRLGGIGGVLLSPGQLMFEVRDLFVAIGQLLLEVRNLPFVTVSLAPELFVLFTEPLNFAAEIFEKGCLRSSAPTERTSRQSICGICGSSVALLTIIQPMVNATRQFVQQILAGYLNCYRCR
jgi:hypothetical protein